jgi:hypothetical protein
VGKQIYVLRDREFSQVVSNHLRLDFHLVELLARVDTNDATNHLGNHNHVSQMRLLIGLRLLLGLAQLLDQTHGLALETAVEPTTSTSVNNIAELVGGQIQESMVRNIGLAYLLPFEFFKTCVWWYGGQRTDRDRFHGRKTFGRLSSS